MNEVASSLDEALDSVWNWFSSDRDACQMVSVSFCVYLTLPRVSWAVTDSLAADKPATPSLSSVTQSINADLLALYFCLIVF